AHVQGLAKLRSPAALEDDLTRRAEAGDRVALDPQMAAEKLRLIVERGGGKVVEATDPARLPRATKNARELDGARAAHRRDGAALARFLFWLDHQPQGSVEEIGAAS